MFVCFIRSKSEQTKNCAVSAPRRPRISVRHCSFIHNNLGHTDTGKKKKKKLPETQPSLLYSPISPECNFIIRSGWPSQKWPRRITQTHHFLPQGFHGDVDGAFLFAVLVLVAACAGSSLPCLLARRRTTPALSEGSGRFQTGVVEGSTRVGQLDGIGATLWARSWTSRLPQGSHQAGVHRATTQFTFSGKKDGLLVS